MSDTTWSFVFAGRRLLLKSTEHGASIPTSKEVADLLASLGPDTAQCDLEMPAVNGKDSRLHAIPDDFEAHDGFELTELRRFRSARWLRTDRTASEPRATDRAILSGGGHGASNDRLNPDASLLFALWSADRTARGAFGDGVS